MTVKTRAIVLRNLKYGDQSLIVDMLTEQLGRVSFAVRLPKTAKGKLKKQLFQPLTIVDVEFDHHERASLQHIRDIRIATPYYNIGTHPAKLAEAIFLADFLSHATQNEQQNVPLYAYVENCLLWLDAAETGFANFHLVFMMRLSRFLGFFPNLDDYAPGCCFDLREAQFTSVVPLHSDYLKPPEAARVQTLMRMDFPNMHLFQMNRTERNEITATLVHYYRLHVPQMPELQSLGVLQELFD